MAPARVSKAFAPWAAGGAGRSKFNAQRAVALDGRKFASKAERDRYHVLLAMQQAGEIADLTLQPVWHFVINGVQLEVNGRRAKFTADFSYLDKNGQFVCEDVKGVLLPDAALRIALMKAVHGIEVRLIRSNPARRR